MTVKIQSLLPSKSKRGRGRPSRDEPEPDASSKLLDGVTVASRGTCTESPDTSIETALGTANGLLSSNKNAGVAGEGYLGDGGSISDVSDCSNSITCTDLDTTARKLKLGPERVVTFHSQSLGIKLTRCSDGYVRVRSVVSSSATDSAGLIVRSGDEVAVGDVVLQMGDTDTRRPITNRLWADAVAKIKKGTSRPVQFIVASEDSAGRSVSTGNAAAANVAVVQIPSKHLNVPTLEIKVDRALDASLATTIPAIASSDTWEMEQEKTEWVEAEKRQQLEEEKARLRRAQCPTEGDTMYESLYKSVLLMMGLGAEDPRD